MRTSARFCGCGGPLGKPSWADPQGKMSGRSLPEDRKTYKNRRTISGENARRFFYFPGLLSKSAESPPPNFTTTTIVAMKAIVVTDTTGPDGLALRDVPQPVPQAG